MSPVQDHLNPKTGLMAEFTVGIIEIPARGSLRATRTIQRYVRGWFGRQIFQRLREAEDEDTDTDDEYLSDDEEWDEESLVRETYGRHTYNFGNTEIGPIFHPSSVSYQIPDYIDDESLEIDYP
jgi:hypothetical protein